MVSISNPTTVVRNRFVDVTVVSVTPVEYFYMSRDGGNRADVTVEFTMEEGRKVAERETWLFKGEFLSNMLTRATELPPESSFLGAQQSFLDTCLEEVENTPGLKDKLKEVGDLKVYKETFKLEFSK